MSKCFASELHGHYQYAAQWEVYCTKWQSVECLNATDVTVARILIFHKTITYIQTVLVLNCHLIYSFIHSFIHSLIHYC